MEYNKAQEQNIIRVLDLPQLQPKKKKKNSQEHNIIIAPIFRLWNTPSICIDKLAWVEIQINMKLLKITSLKLFSKYFAQMCYDTFHTQNLRKKIFHSQIVYCTFFIAHTYIAPCVKHI